MSDLFGLTLSLGSVSNLEAETAAALEAPYLEARRAAEAATVHSADETGWAERHRLAWLWVMATSAATVFMVRRSRGSEVAKELLGAARGVVLTDRWSGYSWLPLSRRQLCWAHLIRDFRKISESAHAGIAGLGEALLDNARRLFELWRRVRDGTLQRSSFRTYASRLRCQIKTYLIAVTGCANRRAAALARGILRLEPAMWTFVRIPGVEPTNNAAERALRPVVLWRKGSYGSRSEIGHAFVERMLTVVTTLRQHGRNVLEFLREASVAALRKVGAPALVAEAVCP
jgi:transposase